MMEDARNGVMVSGTRRQEVEWPEVPKEFVKFAEGKRGD